jgi:hypothetical protein
MKLEASEMMDAAEVLVSGRKGVKKIHQLKETKEKQPKKEKIMCRGVLADLYALAEAGGEVGAAESKSCVQGCDLDQPDQVNDRTHLLADLCEQQSKLGHVSGGAGQAAQATSE